MDAPEQAAELGLLWVVLQAARLDAAVGGVQGRKQQVQGWRRCWRIWTGSTLDPGWIFWILAGSGSAAASAGYRLLVLLRLGGVTACWLYWDTERRNPVSEGRVGGRWSESMLL